MYHPERCDVQQMLEPRLEEPDFIVDGIHFGRGDQHVNNDLKLMHSTAKITCWRIIDEQLDKIEDFTSFFDDETYIVEWVFDTLQIHLQKGVKDEVKGRRLLFYWKGQNAPKGFSPLPEEVKIDNPPVERIVQWAEPPVFLRLFAGKLKVHKRNNTGAKLYLARGEHHEELHFYEVPCKVESLRTRGCFVLVPSESDRILFWFGVRSTLHSRTLIPILLPKVFPGKHLTSFPEGLESTDFWKALEGDKKDYACPLHDVFPPRSIQQTPRLFYFNSITGQFLATEVENTLKGTHVQAFPFLQSHLYSAAQPAIFMLDDYDHIWMWKGWNTEENKNFESEWKAAKETAVAYVEDKKNKCKIYGIMLIETNAGVEPLVFTNLFPFWNKREDIVQLQEGKKSLVVNF